MKGIELPINTIIVMILVLIVLLAILGLFYGVWTPGSQTATLEGVKSNACQKLISTGGCSSTDDYITTKVYINNFDANKDDKTNDGASGYDTNPATYCKADSPSDDNLFMLCECWYSIGGADAEINKACKVRVCNCPTS